MFKNFGSGTGGNFGNQQQTTPLFGGNTSTPPFGGGFGAGSSTNTTTSGFGGGGGFGTPSANTSTGFTFGGGATTPSTNLFGGSTGFGTGNALATTSSNPLSYLPASGTSNPPYTTTNERDPAGPLNVFHSISAMQSYKNYSFEELRLADYNIGRKFDAQRSGFGIGPGTTSAFGAPTTQPTVFGGSSSTTGFGGSTTGFGAQNTGSSTFSFGAQPAAPSTLGGFGTGNTPSTNNLFGSNKFGVGTGTTGFGATTPTTGFGATAPAGGTTGFGASSSNPFGSSLTTNTSQAPLFGAKPQTSTTTSAFGSTNTGFGSLNTQNQNTSSFGFGGAKPAATGGFGTSTTTPTFGAGFGASAATNTTVTTPSTLNLGFGAATKPTTAFGFNTSGTNSLGAFGNTPATNTSTSLFSNINPTATSTATNTTGFPSLKLPSTTNTSFGIGSGLSTMQSQQPTNTNSLGLSGFGFGSGTSGSVGNTSSLFGQQNQIPNLQTTVDKSPYGDISIYQGTTNAATGGGASSLSSISSSSIRPNLTPTPISPTVKKKGPTTIHHKITPKPGSKMQLPGFKAPPFKGFSAPEPKSFHFFDHNINQDDVLSPEAFVKRGSRTLVANKVINPIELTNNSKSDSNNKHDENILIIPQTNGNTTKTTKTANTTTSTSALASTNTTTPIKKSVTFDAKLESSAKITPHSFSPTHFRQVTPPPASKLIPENQDTPLNTPSRSPLLKPLQPSLQQSTSSGKNKNDNYDGYYSFPPLSVLKRMSTDELKNVENFSVGRHDFGKVEYDEPVDLSEIKPIENIYGKTIVVEDGSCTVYGGDADKPPVGKGLNKRAVITLNKCWALDKATRQPIKDPIDPRYQQRILRLKDRPNTKFITYVPETGSWVFEVQHFTTYGLEYESDDDLYEVKPYQPIKRKSNYMEGMEHNQINKKEKKGLYQLDQLAENLGDIESMRNIIFSTVDNEISDDADLDSEMIVDYEQDSCNTSTQKIHLAGESPLIPHFPFTQIGCLPYQQSTIYQKNLYKKNARSLLSHSFKVSWGPNFTLVKITDKRAKTTVLDIPSSSSSAFSFLDKKKKNHESSSSNNKLLFQPMNIVRINEVLLFPRDEMNEAKEIHIKQLEHLFNNSTFEQADNVPCVDLNPSIKFSSFYDILSSSSYNDSNNKNITSVRHEIQTWNLAHILWDIDDDNLPDKLLLKTKRQFLSKWFEQAADPYVKRDLVNEFPTDCSTADEYFRYIFILLSGHQLKQATLKTIKINSFLATLLCQVGGSPQFRNYIGEQIKIWKKFVTKTDYENNSLLRLFYLMQGASIPESLPDHVNLGWVRLLGMFFWYGLLNNQPFEAALDQYEEAQQNSIEFQSKIIPEPLAWYIQDDDNDSWSSFKDSSRVFDAQYHLLKINIDSTYTLEESLLPRSFTRSPLDYRLTWMFHAMLARIKRKRDFVEGSYMSDAMTLNFVSQIEQLGIWKWALYISLFLNEPHTREKAIKDILNRNIPKTSMDQLSSIEQFAIEHLKIPKEWFAEAKALYSKYNNDKIKEVMYLLEANNNLDAHTIVLTELAPSYFLEKNYKELGILLEKIKKVDLHDSIWENGCKFYLNFLNNILPYLTEMTEIKDLGEIEKREIDKDIVEKVKKDCQEFLNDLNTFFNFLSNNKKYEINMFAINYMKKLVGDFYDNIREYHRYSFKY
ncbi:10553_t:CDS:10 [Entrophospora sp. SA101]|nr:10553_t:CDS:10 [Entrophospora sp. SA101]